MSRQLDNYVKSAIPEPYTIMGLRMQPFSLGHLFLMTRFGCSYSSDDITKKAGLGDFILALTICSRNYKDNIDFFNNDIVYDNKLRNCYESILSRITNVGVPQRWIKRWINKVKWQLRFNKQFDVMEHMLTFDKYRKDGLIIPKFWESGEETSKTSGSHWSQGVLYILTSELGYSYNEAMDLPLSRALVEYFKCMEAHGAITFMDDDDLEIVDSTEQS